MLSGGALLISLDFELHWGLRERFAVDDIRGRLLGARAAVPEMLQAFGDRGVRATWATVGLLLCASCDEAIARVPAVVPDYPDARLLAYSELGQVGRNEEEDPFHFAGSLIDQIVATPGQELGSHTFSHFFCLDARPDRAAFRADLAAAVDVAAGRGVGLRSLVFPKNQIRREYFEVVREAGFCVYRGAEPTPLSAPRPRCHEQLSRRALRLLDAYVNVTPIQSYPLPDAPVRSGLVTVPASRYLRGCAPWSKGGERLRIERIKCDLEHAARRGEIYHMWWHPHDFGNHLTQNLGVLTEVLDWFAVMRERYGMASLSMADVAGRVLGAAAAAA